MGWVKIMIDQISIPPIQLFFWPTPNGYKISIMLEECDLAYDVTMIDITKGDQFEPEFLKIAPNNRMPAIIDPDGPDGQPLTLFESGAILQYLARKTSTFYGRSEREQCEVDQWLHWQMGGLGPMAGQAHHFRRYAPEEIPYGIERYTNEVNRLYGVLEKQLEGNDFITCEYSIADIAAFPWVRCYKMQGQNVDEFPNIKAWMNRIYDRPAVTRGLEIGKKERQSFDIAKDDQAKSILFNQRSR